MSRRPLRLLAAGVLAGLAGCLPQRVDIVEHAPAGYLATARSDAGGPCSAALRQRVAEEEESWCAARGRSVMEGTRREAREGDRCVVQALFDCGGALR